MTRIGSDTGGTFTDLVADDGSIAKVPSTPEDPGEAVRAGIEVLLRGRGSSDPTRPAVLAHGTTVATNALLERRGARVALVTNEGFADIIEIARQDRPSLYDQTVDRPEPIVPRKWRYEVRGRLAADGTEIEPVDLTTLPELAPDIEAVAVCLLHSDRNPAHERVVAHALRQRGYDVTASHELSPEFREFERTVTTAINAYLRPVCRSYLSALQGAADAVYLMTSAGGLTASDDGAERPAALLLSGPAGGVLAGAAIAAANGYRDAITFDMGGTSTDVCLVLDGVPEPAAEREVAGLPVRMPSLDVHTIGAGGGSIARIDEGGALVVGPRSAGAVPGPAGYGHGGTEPTVTDANLVAGHIPGEAEFPGLGRLDVHAATDALRRAGVTAEGVLAVVNANMEQALRTVSVERGVDPRGLALVAFGGAGPLHACALADALDMPAVIIPPRAGVFSAVGILCASERVDRAQSWPSPDFPGGDVEPALAVTGVEAARALGRMLDQGGGVDPRADDDGPSSHTIHIETWLDCRYEGQSHELRIPISARPREERVGPLDLAGFHAEHERRNGYARWDAPVEIVAIRARAWRLAPMQLTDLPVVDREPVSGPQVITEPDCTILVPEGWRAEPGEAGALVLRRVESTA